MYILGGSTEESDNKIMLKRIITLFALLWAAPLLADDVKVPEVTDFSREAAVIAEQRLPMLVMFSQTGCAYCVRLEEEYLKPMLRSGDYENKKVLIRMVKIDRYLPLTDFNGEQVEPDEFSSRYDVRVTPTMALLGPDGELLTKPIIGIGDTDYFWLDIDSAIESALQRLRADSALARNP